MTKVDDGLRSIIMKHIKDVHWTPIESSVTISGIADLHGLYNSIDAWVETKRIYGYQIRTKPAQIGWHARRAREGGRCFIACRRRHLYKGTQTDGIDEMYLYSGADLEQLAEVGVRGNVPCLGHWTGGPTYGWNWREIKTILFGVKFGE